MTEVKMNGQDELPYRYFVGYCHISLDVKQGTRLDIETIFNVMSNGRFVNEQDGF